MIVRFENAIFHTMEDEHDVRFSMDVQDGVIVGFDRQTKPDRTIDLGGRHVFPALIDAHLHLLDTVGIAGISTEVCSFASGKVQPTNLAGVGRLIEEHASTHKGSLFVFSNYIANAIEEGRLPNRHELDEWTGGARAWVLNIDGHSSSCSTEMLKQLGFAKIAPDGILAGEAHDANLGRVTEYLSSSITPGLLGDGIADFCNECASFGIGSICALDGTEDLDNDRLTALIAFLAQRFPIDVRLFPQFTTRSKVEHLIPRMAKKRVGGCMRWELDGSVGSRTAAFTLPFSDGSYGTLYFDDAELEATIRSFAEDGYQVSAHAIGDRAIHQLLDILERVPGRHRIDHCEFPAKEDIERICRVNPFITVQPGYAWIDKRYVHGYEKWLNHQAVQQQVPLRTLAEWGVTLCGSSDSPVQSVDPFLQMRGMREFYLEGESLSAFQALKTYTVNGGDMLGEKKGLLRAGYEASFFTIGADLLSIEPQELSGLNACRLFIRGEAYRPMPRGARALAKLALARPRAL